MTQPAKHTPGPWVSTGPHSREVVTYNTGTYRPAMTIAKVNGYWDGEALANMRLIAAAPAMYEALGELIAYLRNNVADEALDNWAPVLKAAYALAQAEGSKP